MQPARAEVGYQQFGTVRLDHRGPHVDQLPVDFRRVAAEGRIVVQPAAFSSASTPTAISLDGHTRQLADMIRAVKTGARPAIDVYEGRKPVDLILAIYRSAEEGRPIDL